MKIQDIDFGDARVSNCVKNAVWQKDLKVDVDELPISTLLDVSPSEWLRTPNFGRKSLKILVEVLDRYTAGAYTARWVVPPQPTKNCKPTTDEMKSWAMRLSLLTPEQLDTVVEMARRTMNLRADLEDAFISLPPYQTPFQNVNTAPRDEFTWPEVNIPEARPAEVSNG